MGYIYRKSRSTFTPLCETNSSRNNNSDSARTFQWLTKMVWSPITVAYGHRRQTRIDYLRHDDFVYDGIICCHGLLSYEPYPLIEVQTCSFQNPQVHDFVYSTPDSQREPKMLWKMSAANPCQQKRHNNNIYDNILYFMPTAHVA